MASPIWTAVVDIGDKILHSKIQKIFMHVPNVWRYPYLFSLIHKNYFSMILSILFRHQAHLQNTDKE